MIVKLNREDENKMRKSVMVRVICLAVAGIMLTSALVVAAVNGSPYEKLKNALFDAASYTNATMKGEMSVSFNGEVYETERVHMIITETGHMEFHGSLEDPDIFFYNSNGLQIRPSIKTDDGTQWYTATLVRDHDIWRPIGITPEERNSARFRFAELLIDLIVGDLKNNLTMSTNDGITRVSGAVTHNQLPEIIRLGIDVIVEESQRWHNGDFGVREDYRNPMDIPIQSLTIDRIRGYADINDQGNLIYLDIYASINIINVFGDSNHVELKMTLSFSEIGTSVIQSPITGVAELLTPEFMANQFGTVYHRPVYFILNADGSINSESVTTAWPGGR